MATKTKRNIESQRLQELGRLQEQLARRIQGQPEVGRRLTEALIRRELETVPQRGPRDAFFFAGPTGVGKSETVQVVAEILFGPGHLQIFDCSEFKTLEIVSSLLGSPSGDPGRFRSAYERVPRGAWLFDEVEKSHPDFVHYFLQMADFGRLTQANGDTLDLSGIYLFMTSNLGSAEILGREHLPFSSLERHVIRAVERHLRPELLGRFDRPYVFRPLGRETQRAIATQYLDELVTWELRQHGRRIVCDAGVLECLIQRGFSPRLGARPLLRVVRELVGNAIAQNLLAGGNGSGQLLVSGDRLRLIP